MADDDINVLLGKLDWELQTLFQIVTRFGNEAHLDADDIAELLHSGNAEALEIISDTADELTMKAQTLIVDARLAIGEWRETSK